ncbi:unnamed protein product [Aureobasidium mustum]|uniref:RNase III domain-containing protein n=1 Tax=Aureobasidium mustum TaxID=2773714 RepID=A0A9N8PKT1_9PEZI|nr:unnamed protein product [Aureobasidium mustum]
MLKQKQINRIEVIIDYQFQNTEKAFLWEALQMTTPTQPSFDGRSTKGGNKKFAILGDAVMAVVVAEHWFSKKDSLTANWAQLHSARLSNDYLKQVASKHNLVNYTERPPNGFGEKSAATLLEAIIGAVYLDSNRDMDAVRRAMIALGFSEVLNEPDHSTKLRDLVQEIREELER